MILGLLLFITDPLRNIAHAADTPPPSETTPIENDQAVDPAVEEQPVSEEIVETGESTPVESVDATQEESEPAERTEKGMEAEVASDEAPEEDDREETAGPEPVEEKIPIPDPYFFIIRK